MAKLLWNDGWKDGYLPPVDTMARLRMDAVNELITHRRLEEAYQEKIKGLAMTAKGDAYFMG